MQRLAVSTDVYVPRSDVYEFLLDFPRYSTYSKYLRRVEQDGDGDVGTRYRLTFSWWRLTYTLHTRVTGVEKPERIDWEVTRHLDARGHWRMASVDPPADRDHATRVTLAVEYNPDSVEGGALDLPAFVSLDWVVDRVEGLVRQEGERVVERIVADLEGERRAVDLAVDRG